MAETYKSIAPIIATAITKETDAAVLIPEKVMEITPVVPILTKAVVLETIKYVRWIGNNIYQPAQYASERTNGPRDIVNRVCKTCGPNAINEQQVLQIIQEWQQFVGWKNQTVIAAPIGDIEP